MIKKRADFPGSALQLNRVFKAKITFSSQSHICKKFETWHYITLQITEIYIQ